MVLNWRQFYPHPRRHLAISGDIFDHYRWEGVVVATYIYGKRLEMLLNTL